MPVPKPIAALTKSLVDIPVLRPLTAIGASLFASLLARRRVRIFFDTVWLRQEGKVVVALGPRLRFRPSQARMWEKNATDVIDVVGHWWFKHYQPGPGDVVVDVGAGMGEDTLLFSRLVGSQGKVYAFEAHPTTFACLQKAVHYNQAEQATLVHAAVSREAGELFIEDRSAECWQNNSVITAQAGHSDRIFSVQAMALDTFSPLQAQPRIDFLKMNIEGAEVDALAGMPQLLAKVRHACIACHDFLAENDPRMKTKAACKAMLEAAGFEVFEITEDCEPALRDHLHAVRRSAPN
jgi:FkbM family methyltransferase